MAPATPTGLHVDETTETSIEWHWNAVEGALAYAVQISMDEVFDDTDQIDLTIENHYTVSDLAPMTSVYLRVAAAAGTLEAPIRSDWSTHVTGMTAMPPPPPPPPAPDPVMVTFSLSDDAKSQHFMVADDDDDEATAMASVNTEIMVESNSTAVVTPMFVDGATGVSVDAMAGNMPFSYVSWSMMQSAVLSDGATFMVQRTTVGANQEMEPTGDVMYITCGPFACEEGSDAPEITIENSSVCEGFDPDVSLQVGKIDNDVLPAEDTDDARAAVANDGIDIGWVTSQKGAMSVTHKFDGVAKGRNYSVAGRDSTSGTDKPLKMDLGDGDDTTVGADDPDNKASTTNAQYMPALRVSAAGAATAACLEYASRNVRGGLDKPDNCFRLVGDPDYLSGYTVEVAAKGSGVTWGSVNWDDDPFADLECPSMTFAAAEQVNVCDLFEDEVDQATKEGWKTLTWVFGGPATDGTDTVLSELQAAVKGGASPHQFTTLWFDHDLDGRIKTTTAKPEPMHDLYDQNDADTTDTTPGSNFVNGAAQANQMHVEISLLDKDDDPAIGDFGKVDILEAGRTDDPDTAATEDESDFAPDGKADNFTPAVYSDVRACTEDDGGDDADNTICDANRDWDVTVKFASGTFGCETERSFTISCTWDASGERNQTRRDSDQTAAVQLTADNIDDFLKCEVE